MDLITCPSAKLISAYVRGEMEGALAEQLADHLKMCSRCVLIVAHPDRYGREEPPVEDGTVASLAANFNFDLSSPLSDNVATYSLSFLGPASGPDELGWLGNYRVTKVLGEGGMGMVLLAEDTDLQRAVALKVMKPEILIYPDARDRFMREAKAMAKVKSEHVVTIHQVGEFNETCFIAMELLEGEPLDDFMSRETSPSINQSLRIGREIAAALAAAHNKGLVHRDIKPENVWLEAPAGRVKLLDFGLARPQVVTDKLTMSGMIMGTPSYMSPEQAHGREVDERTDLWSLGCLLYHLVCGQKPFEGPTLMSTLMAIVEHEPAPPSDFYPDMPQGVDELVMKLLAKDKEKRWQKASEVIDKIAEIESRLPAQTLKEGQSRTVDGGRSFRYTMSGSSRFTGTQSQVDREAERRQVSLFSLSCDLFTSDQFLDLDADQQRDILVSFENVCREVSQKFSGTIVQCNEEELLVCFGYPTAFEDATLLAARCGLALLDALAPLSKQFVEQYGCDLKPRSGLHTGLSVVETKGREISLVGDAKKLATRIMNLASDWQLVCSDTTHRLLKGRFDCDDLGQQKIRGANQPVSVFQIKSEKEFREKADHAPSPESIPVVGRDLELYLLKDRWAQAKEGMGQIVLLGGEAGVGKSHIVQAIKQHVGADIGGGDSQCIIEWSCSPHFRNTSLNPACSFLEHALKLERGDSLEEKYQRLLAYLQSLGLLQADLVPIFASLLGLPTCDKFPTLSLTPAREREEIFRALLELLRACSREHAVLFVVEDLHWVDASTQQFLEQFFVDGLNEQILVVLTFRPEFRVPWPLSAQHTSISLNRLNRQQAGEMVSKQAGRLLPEAIVAQICERAGGVPLFIEEFTRMVLDSGLLDQANSDGSGVKTLMARAVPSTLQEIIIARLERLEAEINLAQLAAAVGRTFNYQFLLEVSGMEEKALRSELSKLVHGDILFEKGRPPKATYAFKHVLFQDALYNALVKPKRRQFHQRIAETLEAHNQHNGEVVSEILAHHLTEAGLIEKSIVHWLAAGLRSQESYAITEAISHFTTGLELLATLPPSTDRDNSELLLLNPLGSAYQNALGYSAPVVGPLFARARSICERIGEPSQLLAIMWGNWTWHLVRGDLALCLELADEMMAFAAATGDSGMIMEAHVAPAVTRFYRGDFSGCAHYCKEAILHYEDAEQCRLWAAKTGQNAAVVIRCYLALALWHLGYMDNARQALEEMLGLARQCEHPFSLGHALHFAGWFYQHCQMADKLMASADEQLALASQKGFALWEASGVFLKGAGIVLQGKNEEGLEAMEEGLRKFKAVNAALTLAAQLSVLADTYIKVQNFEAARQALSEGFTLADKYEDRYQEAELHRIAGKLSLAEDAEDAGHQAAAEKSFKQSIAIARKQHSAAWELRSTISLAHLLKKQGRAQEARTALGDVLKSFPEGLALPTFKEAKELLKTCS